MKVIICGGRNYSDTKTFKSALACFERAHGKITKVVHGAATGADKLAANWAAANGLEQAPYPADWSGEGRAAGPRRNARMLSSERTGLFAVIAFPGGRGTANMIQLARKARVLVYRVD